MKIALVFVLILLFVNADVELATSAEEVTNFLDANQNNIAALFFLDSSLNEGNEGGFWSGVVTSVSHIFSGEDEDIANGQKVSEIEQRISDEADLMQIDVSNEDLRLIQEQYDVTTVPFLIIFKKGVLVLKEVPTHETHDKVLQILDINPTAIHQEDDVVEIVEVEKETSVEVVSMVDASETKESTATEAPESIIPVKIAQYPQERNATVAQVDRSRADLRQPIPQRLAPLRPAPLRPAHQRPSPQRPTHQRPTPQRPTSQRPAPVRPTPEEKQSLKNNTEIDREYIHNRCTDVTTAVEDRKENWRSSYIGNLEDYQIPEDWWRNGYTPISGNDTEANGYTRKVQFSEDEHIVFEPTDVIVRPTPVKPAPVRPAHVIPAPVRPAHVIPAPVRPAHVIPTPVRPAHVIPAPVRPAHVAPAHVISAPVKPHVVAPQPRPAVRPTVVEARLPHIGKNTTVAHEARAIVKPNVAPVRIAAPTVSSNRPIVAPTRRAPVATGGRPIAPRARPTVVAGTTPRVAKPTGGLKVAAAPHITNQVIAGTAPVRPVTNTTSSVPNKR